MLGGLEVPDIHIPGIESAWDVFVDDEACGATWGDELTAVQAGLTVSTMDRFDEPLEDSLLSQVNDTGDAAI